MLTVNYDEAMKMYTDINKLLKEIPNELVADASFGGGFKFVPSPTTKNNVEFTG